MQPAITITSTHELAADPARLSPAERALAGEHRRQRRDEWIRGRLAMRAALVALLGADAATIDILVAPDAAPLLVGGPACAISLSHDESWLAVAVVAGPCRLGIDLCARSHGDQASRVLRRLGIHHDCEPVAAWAALETVLKLRRLGVLELRERTSAVVGDRDQARVTVVGLGAPAQVTLRSSADHVVGWAIESAL